jgi:hypothetical protein
MGKTFGRPAGRLTSAVPVRLGHTLEDGPTFSVDPIADLYALRANASSAGGSR